MKRVALGIAALAAACSGSALTPMMVSSPAGIGVGEQRVLVAFLDLGSNTRMGSADLAVTATLRDRNGSPLTEHRGRFVPVAPGEAGVFAFQLDIPRPGTYQMTFDAGKLGRLGPMGLVALAASQVVGVADPAPLSVTPTLADHDLEVLTSDPDPVPAFYARSLDDALSAGPTVVVFASPGRCSTEPCRRMLGQVKRFSEEFPLVNYVHVELFEADGDRPVPAAVDWGVASESWVFVTDSAGVIAASFEWAVSDDELREALARVTPP